MRYTLGGVALHDVHPCAADDVPAVLSAMILCSQVWGQAANKTFSQALILMHTVFLLYLFIRVIDASMRII